MQNPLKKPRKSYPIDYKLKVLDYSRGKFNREVAEHFKIDEKNVRRWKKSEQKLRDLDKKNQTFNANTSGSQFVKKKFRLKGAGRKVIDTDRDVEVLDWIMDKRSRQMPVSGKEIKRKAKQITDEKGNNANFKVLVY